MEKRSHIIQSIHNFKDIENQVNLDINRIVRNNFQLIKPKVTCVIINDNNDQLISSIKKEIKIFDEIIVAKEAVWLYEKFGEGEYKDILGLCKVASLTEIEEKGWSLTPGAYVGVAPVEDDGVDFEDRMLEIHRELLSLQAEANNLMDTISKNMKEMGL